MCHVRRTSTQTTHQFIVIYCTVVYLYKISQILSNVSCENLITICLLSILLKSFWKAGVFWKHKSLQLSWSTDHSIIHSICTSTYCTCAPQWYTVLLNNKPHICIALIIVYVSYIFLIHRICRAVASVGPGGGGPAPPDKVLPPPGWPGAVYRKFPK